MNIDPQCRPTLLVDEDQANKELLARSAFLPDTEDARDRQWQGIARDTIQPNARSIIIVALDDEVFEAVQRPALLRGTSTAISKIPSPKIRAAVSGGSSSDPSPSTITDL